MAACSNDFSSLVEQIWSFVVQDLEVLKIGHGRRQLCDLVVTQGQPGDVLHPPHSRHVGLKGDEGLVREVQFSILDPLGLLQGLLDDLGGHVD